MTKSKEPEFEVTVTIRNNRLKSRRKKLGFSQKFMAAAIGISHLCWCDLEQLKRSPIDRHGYWTKDAVAVADYFEVEPEELWPDLVTRVIANKITRTLSSDEMRLFSGAQPTLLPAAQRVARSELKEEIKRALRSLKPQEEFVLRESFGIDGKSERTNVEIGTDLGVTRTRIDQIMNKALRKLRHPSRSKALLEYTDIGHEEQ